MFSALNSFAVVLSGLASNSRYSLIGGVRAIAQLISYELPLSVSALTLFMVQGSFGLKSFASSKLIFICLVLPAIIIFFISLLAETNRTPFDLPEAEAELVAGYNLEYSSILFSLFFLAEYSNILVASSILAIIVFPGKLFYLAVLFFAIAIVVVRAILPRYTYAQLIDICWCRLLPLSLFTFLVTSFAIYAFGLDANNHVTSDMSDFINAVAEQKSTSSDQFYSGMLFLGFLKITDRPASLSAAAPANHNLTNAEIDAILGVSQRNVFLFFIVALVIVCALVGLN